MRDACGVAVYNTPLTSGYFKPSLWPQKYTVYKPRLFRSIVNNLTLSFYTTYTTISICYFTVFHSFHTTYNNYSFLRKLNCNKTEGIT